MGGSANIRTLFLAVFISEAIIVKCLFLSDLTNQVSSENLYLTAGYQDYLSPHTGLGREQDDLRKALNFLDNHLGKMSVIWKQDTIYPFTFYVSAYLYHIISSHHCLLVPDTQYSSMPGKILAAVEAKTEATTESNHRYAQVAAAISLGNMTWV